MFEAQNSEICLQLLVRSKFFFFVGCIAIACTERSMLALRLCILHWAHSVTHTEADIMSTVSGPTMYQLSPTHKHATCTTISNPTKLMLTCFTAIRAADRAHAQQIARGTARDEMDGSGAHMLSS